MRNYSYIACEDDIVHNDEHEDEEIDDEDIDDEAEREVLLDGEGRDVQSQSNGAEDNSEGGSASIEERDVPSGSDGVVSGDADNVVDRSGELGGTDERDGATTGAVRVDLISDTDEHAPVHSKSSPPICVPYC
jgi:hypothetical protein